MRELHDHGEPTLDSEAQQELGDFQSWTRMTKFGSGDAVRRLSLIDGGNIDLCYLEIHNKSATYAQDTGTESRQTVGTRLWGVRGAWDSNSKFIGQTGTFGGVYILGVECAYDTGYTLDPVPLQPRIGLRAGVASGDLTKMGQTFRLSVHCSLRVSISTSYS